MAEITLYFIVACLLSLLLWLAPLWRWRGLAAWLFMALDIAIASSFVIALPGLASLLFASVTVYKLFNYARIVRGRMHVDFLRRATLKSAILLTLTQVLITVGVGGGYADYHSAAVAAYALTVVQVFIASVIWSSTQRHLRTTKTLQTTTAFTDQQLPSISVLIPARNETEDLHACLEALVASNYPKLEIIVLDDCSQNKRTPEVIRQFAQQGVRYIAGQAPTDSWLAKNFAYQQLADAANGELLLFCGVDLRLSPGAIRELVTTMLEKNKTMISILPQNDRPRDIRTLLVQPMRYAWELSLPRRLFNRPPVLSTCWIIKRDILRSAGSFKATSRSIVPESHFARFAARNDGYSFLRSNLLVSSKPAAEQQATAIRMRYPQLHRRIELVWLLTLLELVVLVLPLPLATAAALQGVWPVFSMAITAYVLLGLALAEVTGVMYGRPLASSALLMPVAALYDLLLLHVSMYRYEFSEVRWKERNICLPIMRFDEPAVSPAANPGSQS